MIKLLKKSKRPLILAGNGIRLSGAASDFLKLVEKLQVPVVTGITAHDLIPTSHKMFFGRPGIFGERVGNFMVANCDLMLAIGSRLSVWVTTFDFRNFARGAKHIVVDIDRAELTKNTISCDLAICTDAKEFILEFWQQLAKDQLPKWSSWLSYAKRLKGKYPPVLQVQRNQKKYVNSYYFVEVLSKHLAPREVIVVGDGTAFTCTYQCIKLKRGQRLIGNVGAASMGYDLPAAIGASIARGKKRVVAIAGDGSIQMNLQELQTIVHNKLPIKIFVINNNGYLAIRITQDNYFKSHYVGADPKNGISFPDMKKVAYAYNIPFSRVASHRNLDKIIKSALDSPGPFICEIMMDPKQPLIPKVTSYVRPDGKVISKPMEDMYPFLPRDEFLENMIIKPIPEQ